MCIWLACMSVRLYIPCVPGAHRGQKMALDSLELELQMIIQMCTLEVEPKSYARVALALNL